MLFRFPIYIIEFGRDVLHHSIHRLCQLISNPAFCSNYALIGFQLDHPSLCRLAHELLLPKVNSLAIVIFRYACACLSFLSSFFLHKKTLFSLQFEYLSYLVLVRVPFPFDASISVILQSTIGINLKEFFLVLFGSRMLQSFRIGQIYCKRLTYAILESAICPHFTSNP